MTQHNNYLQALELGLNWLQRMMPASDGSKGVYERYRVSLGRVNPWIRPDCSIEVARTFYAYGSCREVGRTRSIGLRLARFVRSLQRREKGFFHGSFPFYLFRPEHPAEPDIGDGFGIPDLAERAWPNDNGKVIYHLLWFYKQSRSQGFLEAARRGLNYLQRIQSEDGSFSRTPQGEEVGFKGADFVIWPTVALIEGALVTQVDSFGEAARKGLMWLRRHQHPSGRMLTSYETARTEAWRPPSSETVAALSVFAKGTRLFPKDLWIRESLDGLGQAVLALQHESGAIRNCYGDSCLASLQNDPDVTDLVYTDGYALLALEDAYTVSNQPRYLESATRLADFLTKIQCRNESDAYDGGWRGSYHLQWGTWYGKANQENPIDEGGMDSVYTGWASAPILYGLVRLVCQHKLEL